LTMLPGAPLFPCAPRSIPPLLPPSAFFICRLDIKGQIEDIEYFIKTQKAVEDSPNKAEIQGGRMIIG
jgi:hypothetical protein